MGTELDGRDTSKVATSIARKLDRLEPGHYEATITKPRSENASWTLEIRSPDTGRVWRKTYYS